MAEKGFIELVKAVNNFSCIFAQLMAFLFVFTIVIKAWVT